MKNSCCDPYFQKIKASVILHYCFARMPKECLQILPFVKVPKTFCAQEILSKHHFPSKSRLVLVQKPVIFRRCKISKTKSLLVNLPSYNIASPAQNVIGTFHQTHFRSLKHVLLKPLIILLIKGATSRYIKAFL